MVHSMRKMLIAPLAAAVTISALVLAAVPAGVSAVPVSSVPSSHTDARVSVLAAVAEGAHDIPDDGDGTAGDEGAREEGAPEGDGGEDDSRDGDGSGDGDDRDRDGDGDGDGDGGGDNDDEEKKDLEGEEDAGSDEDENGADSEDGGDGGDGGDDDDSDEGDASSGDDSGSSSGSSASSSATSTTTTTTVTTTKIVLPPPSLTPRSKEQLISNECRICLHAVRSIVPRDPRDAAQPALPCAFTSDASMQDACTSFVATNRALLTAAVNSDAVCKSLGYCQEKEEKLKAEEEKRNKELALGKLQLFAGVAKITAAAREFKYLENGSGRREALQRVTFKAAFEHVPRVQATISGFSFSEDHDYRVVTEVRNVDKLGFDLIVATWKHTELKDLEVNWVAYGQVYSYRNLIRVGKISNSGSESFARRVRFPRPFAAPPTINMGFHGVTVRRGAPLSAFLEARDIEKDAFTAVFRTDAASRIDAAAISWIAFEQKAAGVYGGEHRIDGKASKAFARLGSPPYGPRSYTQHIRFTPAPVVVCEPIVPAAATLAAESERAGIPDAAQDSGTELAALDEDRFEAVPAAKEDMDEVSDGGAVDTDLDLDVLVSSSRRGSNATRGGSNATARANANATATATANAVSLSARRRASYARVILAASPDAFWDLRDARDLGYARDLTNRSRDMTANTDEPSLLQFQSPPIAAGTGMSLRSRRGFLSVRGSGAKDVPQDGSNFAVEMWVRPNYRAARRGKAGVMGLASRIQMAGKRADRRGFSTFLYRGRVYFMVYGGKGKGFKAIRSRVSLRNGVAYHVVCRQSNGVMAIYVNGKRVSARRNKIAAAKVDGLFLFGSLPSPRGRMWGQFKGRASALAFYTGRNVPSVKDITAHFDAGRTSEEVVVGGSGSGGSPARANATAAGREMMTLLGDAIVDDRTVRPRKCRTITEYPPVFEGAPMVSARIAGLKISPDGGARVSVSVLGVNRDGFILRVHTWSDTKIEGIEVSWTALPRPLGYPPHDAAAEKANAIRGLGAFNSPVNAPTSCRQALLKGQSLGNGVYWLHVLGKVVRAFCDMTGGGWTRVITIRQDSWDHAKSGEVNLDGLRDGTVPAKLSDKAISLMSTVGIFKVTCGKWSGFARNTAFKWDSTPENDLQWQVNRSPNFGDLNDDAWCDASRKGYTFSEEDAAKEHKCLRSDYMRYADATEEGEKGCFHDSAEGGWERNGFVWVQ